MKAKYVLCGVMLIASFAHCAPQCEKTTGSTIGYATYYTVASCQREGTSGTLTASGERYNESLMTCALWRVGKHGRPLRPDGRLVRVQNVENGKELVVRWTDNGPGRKARERGVVIDLTPAAFEKLGGKLRDGRIRVEIQEA